RTWRRRRPDWREAGTRLARILPTHPDATLRNGTEAVQLAERACQQTNHRNVGALDTLAAAYAEVGRFQEAVQTAESALQIAQSAGQPQLVQSIRAHADAYRLSQPVREKRARGASRSEVPRAAGRRSVAGLCRSPSRPPCPRARKGRAGVRARPSPPHARARPTAGRRAP